MTQKQIVLDVLRKLNKVAIAEEVIAAIENDPAMSLAEKVRVGKNVHGCLSTLHDEGRIRRACVSTNPETGASVYAYEVEQIQRKSTVKVEKGYKQKCEALERELAEERERNEYLVERNAKFIDKLKELGAYPL